MSMGTPHIGASWRERMQETTDTRNLVHSALIYTIVEDEEDFEIDFGFYNLDMKFQGEGPKLEGNICKD